MSVSKWVLFALLFVCGGCPKKPEPEVPEYKPIQLPDEDLDDLPEEPDTQD